MTKSTGWIEEGWPVTHMLYGENVTVTLREEEGWYKAEAHCFTESPRRIICQDNVGHVRDINLWMAKDMAISFACNNLPQWVPAPALEQLKKAKSDYQPSSEDDLKAFIDSELRSLLKMKNLSHLEILKMVKIIMEKYREDSIKDIIRLRNDLSGFIP